MLSAPPRRARFLGLSLLAQVSDGRKLKSPFGFSVLEPDLAANFTDQDLRFGQPGLVVLGQASGRADKGERARRVLVNRAISGGLEASRAEDHIASRHGPGNQ